MGKIGMNDKYRHDLFKTVSEAHKTNGKRWWNAFESNQDKIIQSFSCDYRGDFDVCSWMAENLESIDSDLCWEFGPGIHRKHRLVITPEFHSELRPLVRYLLAEAPVLDLWEFYEYRLIESVEDTRAILTERAGWPEISNIGFALSTGNHNRIDITFYLPFTEEENSALRKLYILMESLLGEEVLEKWVGAVKVEQSRPFLVNLFAPKKKHHYVSELKSSFQCAIESIKKAYVEPYCEMVKKSQWGVMHIQVKDRPDYPAKADMFVSPFMSETLFRATFDGRMSFCSERFSNNGETFIYLKIDGTAEDFDQEIFSDRGDIEDALNEVLLRENLGCTIGGGTGRRYSYIDLAVNDLMRAIDVMKVAMQTGRMTKRSWFLFHDMDMQSEWIGIYDDSPPPPF